MYFLCILRRACPHFLRATSIFFLMNWLLFMHDSMYIRSFFKPICNITPLVLRTHWSLSMLINTTPSESANADSERFDRIRCFDWTGEFNTWSSLRVCEEVRFAICP